MRRLTSDTKSKTQELYELVALIGEIITGEVHIIDTAHELSNPLEEGSFRVYHKSGYCFDINKELESKDRATNKMTHTYSMYAEWEGFIVIDADTAIRELKRICTDK